MTHTSNGRVLQPLYAGLLQRESEALLARLVRQMDLSEVHLLRDALPEAQRPAHLRLERILLRLRQGPTYLPMALLHRAERDLLALELTLEMYHGIQGILRGLGAIWHLEGYPVTHAEYEQLVNWERDEPQDLLTWAGAVAGDYGADDADDLHPAIAAWLRGPAQDSDEDESARVAAVVALVDAAISDGQLPAPTATTQGRTLPRGQLADWLRPGAEYVPESADHHVPTVRLLGGWLVRWIVKPNRAAVEVRRQRVRLVRTVLTVAGLADELDPHPPADAGAHARARRDLADLPDDEGEADIFEHLVSVGRRHAQTRALLRAYREAVDTLAREDFGGEDPLPTEVRTMLDSAEAQANAFAQRWAMAGDMLRSRLDLEAWPAAPEEEEEKVEAARTDWISLMREGHSANEPS